MRRGLIIFALIGLILAQFTPALAQTPEDTPTPTATIEPTQTPTPTITPTPADQQRVDLSSGNYAMVERHISYGEISITIALGIVALVLVVWFITWLVSVFFVRS